MREQVETFLSGVGTGDVGQAEGLMRALPGDAAALIVEHQAALAVQNQAELKRLTAKYGAHHPRVIARTESVAFDQPFAAALAEKATLVQRLTITPDPSHIIVQGVVRDIAGKPLAGVHVIVLDARGSAVARVASASDGYFKTVFEPAAATDAATGMAKDAGNYTLQTEAGDDPHGFAAKAGTVRYFELTAADRCAPGQVSPKETPA